MEEFNFYEQDWVDNPHYVEPNSLSHLYQILSWQLSQHLPFDRAQVTGKQAFHRHSPLADLQVKPLDANNHHSKQDNTVIFLGIARKFPSEELHH